MPENKYRKKEKKKSIIEEIHKKECSRFAFFMMTSLFIALSLSFLFFLFLKADIYPVVSNKVVVTEVIGVLGNILTLSMILSATMMWSKRAMSLLPCFVLAYSFDLIFVNYLNLNIFGSIISLAILGICLYLAFVHTLKFYAIGGLALLLVNIAIILSINNNIPPQIYNSGKKQHANTENRNIVFIVLSNHIGYDYGMEKATALDEYRKPTISPNMTSKELTEWRDTFKTVIGGFYLSNGFGLFTHAFNYEGNANDLIASTLNLNEDYLKDSSGILMRDGSQKIYNNSPERLALSRNNAFSHLKKEGFNVNVYQSKGVNLCSDNVLSDIDSCYTFSNSGEMYKTKMDRHIKTSILTDMWISSYFKSFSVDKILKKILFIKNPDEYPVVINEQFSVLDQLEKDITKAKGKNFFYAYIRLPYRPFIYSTNCSINDKSEWRYGDYDSSRNNFIKYDYYQKYFSQLFCTYGYMEKFMAKLKKDGALDHTLIVIHGDGGARIFDKAEKFNDDYGKALNAFDSLKSEYSTIFAIYDPFNNTFKAYNRGCDIPTIMRRQLLNNDKVFCKKAPLSDGSGPQNMANSLYSGWETEINASFDSISLVRDFKMWAQEWVDSQDKK